MNAPLLDAVKADFEKKETSQTRQSNIPNKSSTTTSSSAPPPDGWEPEDHEGDKWKKNKDGRWHNEYAKDKEGIPNRPNFQNEDLRKVAQQLYRDTDLYPGGSAGALRGEVTKNLHPRHLVKCNDRIIHLQRILTNNAQTISRVDRQAAESLIHDLREAVKMIKTK